MDSNEIPILNMTVDKSQVPPIHQKRFLAFVNNFIVNTVTFLNKFVVKCETKFINFESKLQKIEASLLIVEAKLASIPNIGDTDKTVTEKITIPTKPEESTVTIIDNPNTITDSSKVSEEYSVVNNINGDSEENNGSVKQNSSEITGVCVRDDIRYKPYFTLLKFGVNIEAIKLKMKNDKIDPNILDDPNAIIPDGIISSTEAES